MEGTGVLPIHPQTAQSGWPPVLVAGGFFTGVVLMRELSRHGLAVYCIDPNPTQPCFRTRYGQSFVCPNPDQQPQDWVDFMLGLESRIGKGPLVVIASSDMFVTALADHAAALSDRFLFGKTSIGMQGLLATKKRQYDIAAEHGLPTPLTRFVTNEAEVEAFGKQAVFPALLKPLHFREWRTLDPEHPLFEQKLITSNSPAELLASYRLAARINPECVVQEIIEGPDTAKLCYLSCYSQKSERLGWGVVRQMRTDPIGFGSASIVEPVHDPETAEVCDRFLRSIGYTGICEIELKRDTRDGVVKLIEANPRYSLTSDAAPYMGVEIGWLHYLDLIGQPVRPVEPQRNDFRHIALFRDFACVPSYFRAGLLDWKGLFHSYRQPRYFFDFDREDPKLSYAHGIRLLRILAGAMVRQVLPKKKRRS
ncbi:hypothetical protein [Bryobacter aggregatus]|uniref:carboxylate--amine ligase n=1 Tax=Bryobacter aggregatus TaxID=360054 RepID=UPI0004E1240F|nr:hypothetical protein [Bryobacter aggregatus]